MKRLRTLIDAKLWKFLLVGVVNTLAGMGIMFGLVDALGWNEMLSKVIATGLVFVWNFLIRRLAIYRKAR